MVISQRREAVKLGHVNHNNTIVQLHAHTGINRNPVKPSFLSLSITLQTATILCLCIV